MLYVSTRNKNDAYTAPRALRSDRAPDDGYFVPFRLPHYDSADIDSLKDKTFGQVLAQLLNQFFSAQLSGWDVDLTVGRKLVKLTQLGSRTAAAELWHNSQSRYAYITENLFRKICNDGAGNQPTDWFTIAVRIATLFGVYAELLAAEIVDRGQTVDISVPAEDLTAAIAAVYARQMGLPIGTVICCCGEDSGVGDFLRRGVLSSRSTVASSAALERLVHAVLGHDEIAKFLDAQGKGGIYSLHEADLQHLNDGLFTASVGTQRIRSVIASIYRTTKYIVEPGAAISFAGLQDYRAITGESRPALLFMENTPMAACEQICAAVGLSAEELAGQL